MMSEQCGARFLELRASTGLTRERFAARVGVGRQAVLHWEQGRGWPTVERLIAICEAFNVSADWLTGLEDFEE